MFRGRKNIFTFKLFVLKLNILFFYFESNMPEEEKVQTPENAENTEKDYITRTKTAEYARLSSLRSYYKKLVAKEEDSEKREKYKQNLEDLNEKIKAFFDSHPVRMPKTEAVSVKIPENYQAEYNKEYKQNESETDKEIRKILSSRSYYKKCLSKNDLPEVKRAKYEAKLRDIDEKLNEIRNEKPAYARIGLGRKIRERLVE